MTKIPQLTDEERKAEFEKLLEENARKLKLAHLEGKMVSVVIPIVASDGKCYAHGVEYDCCPECWAGYG